VNLSKFLNPLILASASPRRKALLKKAGFKFIVDPSNYDEEKAPSLPPRQLAKYLSTQKAKEVAFRHPKAIILAADTLVFCCGQVLGKPKNKKEAQQMLRLLSGSTHQVITAFTILFPSQKKQITKSVVTKIVFRKFSDQEINYYIKTKKPFDKAGAYAIQEQGDQFVVKIIGDYDNVVGLPVKEIEPILRKIDASSSANPHLSS